MSKKMTFRKKGLAVILCLMMGIATIAGCGKEEETPVVEADEDALEIPEVKGKEETVGAFTLLVPKGMEAEEGSSESVVTLSEDDDKNIVFQVVEKSEAKDYVKALIEEDDSFEEITFSLDGTKWSGASYKKDFVVYAKIGKTTVIAIGTGYKYTDDIPLAVLASLEVESDAETVSIGGASGKGGTFVYGDGLFTVEYTGAYREADPSSEFGDLVSQDGDQKVVFSVKEDDMKTFSEKAKKLGILYVTIKNKKETTKTIEVIARASDAQMINHILESMNYPAPAKEDTGTKKAESRVPSDRSSKERGRGATEAALEQDAKRTTSDRKSVKPKLEELRAAVEEREKEAQRAQEAIETAIRKGTPENIK